MQIIRFFIFLSILRFRGCVDNQQYENILSTICNNFAASMIDDLFSLKRNC